MRHCQQVTTLEQNMTLTTATDVIFWSALLARCGAEGWATGGTAVAVTMPRGRELLDTTGGALTITGLMPRRAADGTLAAITSDGTKCKGHSHAVQRSTHRAGHNTVLTHTAEREGATSKCYTVCQLV